MTDKNQVEKTTDQEPMQDRRDAMKKIWKYTAYTAPAVTALLMPRGSSAQVSGMPLM